MIHAIGIAMELTGLLSLIGCAAMVVVVLTTAWTFREESNAEEEKQRASQVAEENTQPDRSQRQPGSILQNDQSKNRMEADQENGMANADGEGRQRMKDASMNKDDRSNFQAQSCEHGNIYPVCMQCYEALEAERDAATDENARLIGQMAGLDNALIRKDSEIERLKAELEAEKKKPMYGPSVLEPLITLEKDRDHWKSLASKAKGALEETKNRCDHAQANYRKFIRDNESAQADFNGFCEGIRWIGKEALALFGEDGV